MSGCPGIEPHYSPPQIAEALGVDPATVLGWIKSGQLRARRLGNGTKRPRHRVAASALEAFLQSREVNAPKPRQRKRRRTETTDFVGMMDLD